jgi:hypothetical protein
MNTRNQELTDRVEFRWRQHEEEFARRLAKSARTAGRSQSEQARELLKDALTASDQLQHAIESLQQEVAQLHHQLRHLPAIKEGVRAVHENIYQFRDNLASCTAKLLEDAGHLDSQAARNWVCQTLDAEPAAEE